MGQEQTGVAVTDAAAPSRWSLVLWALLALLAHLALLDAAVETFWSGSPLRWWVSPLLVVVAAVSVWLWRPGGRLLGRLGPAGAAATPALVFLALLAVTAWLPSGREAGIKLLFQPTGTVIAAVTLAAVVLAIGRIVGVRILPLPAKAALGLLAVYGASALVWGLVLRTPYVALLGGQSLWQRLPFWLQGAFLGAVVVVPAGLVGHLLCVRAAIRAGQGSRWARQAVALVLVTAIALSGIAPGTRSFQSASNVSVESKLEEFPGRFEPAPFPGEVPQSFEDASRRLDQLFTLVKDSSERLDTARFDVKTRATANGPDVERNFAFVRDAIRLEPYSGVLRGARGALMAGSANDLDRSLLLSALLEQYGHRTRIAHGNLSSSAARRLLVGFLQQAPAAESLQADDSTISKASELKLLPLAEATQARGISVNRWVAARAERDASMLLRAVGEPGAWFKDRRAASVADALATHYWLQVERDGTWLDLDSAFPEAKLGQRFADGVDTFSPSEIPEGLMHRVSVSMTVEYAGDERSEEKVLDVTIPAHETAVEQLRVANYPVDAESPEKLAKAKKFRPGLRLGRKVYPGKEYTLDGSSTSVMPDISGGLFSEGPAQRKLTGIWLDIATAGPGVSARTERRYIVDLVGLPARRSKRAAPAEVPLEKLPFLAIRVFDLLVMPSPYDDAWVQWMAARSITENEGVFRAALDVRYKRAQPQALQTAVAKSAAPVFSDALTALASGVSRYLRRQNGNSRLAMQGPFVAMFVQGFEQASVLRTEAGQNPYTRQGYDIVSTGAIPIGGTSAERARCGLAYGAFLTNLELALAMAASRTGAVPKDNASSSAEAANVNGANLKKLVAEADADSLRVSPNARAAMQSDLGEGRILLVAEQGQADAPMGWWRVDSESGVWLGVNEHAEGSSLTEEQKIYVMILISFANSAWCAYKVDDKFEHHEINEHGKNVGMAVCAIGFAVGLFTAFAENILVGILGNVVGMVGDMCGTN